MSIDRPDFTINWSKRGILGTGYYGWREGRTVVLTFKDGDLRLAQSLTLAAALMLHASQSTLAEWFEQIMVWIILLIPISVCLTPLHSRSL